MGSHCSYILHLDPLSAFDIDLFPFVRLLLSLSRRVDLFERTTLGKLAHRCYKLSLSQFSTHNYDQSESPESEEGDEVHHAVSSLHVLPLLLSVVLGA